jgi:nicotinamide riboside transporter PnuC
VVIWEEENTGRENMKKLLMVLLMMCLMVGIASAWTIVDNENRVSGNVDFYSDGSGVINATGYPIINFAWHQNGEMIRATYLFYGVNIYYNASSDELYSPDVSGVTLKR